MKSDNKKHNDLHDLFLKNYPNRSRFAEAFRTLRTNIRFSFMEKDFRSLLVTSAGEEEGKTNAVANLSYTMAKAGKNTLMIDADLRKPFLSKLIPSYRSPGLTGLLISVLGVEIGHGSLGDLGVQDLFRLLNLQKKTGLLHLKEKKEEVELLFLQGDLKDLRWPTRPERKKLATQLVKNELLTKEDMKKAITRHKGTGQKLGFTLINMGLLKKEELESILKIQMLEGLRIPLQFKAGKFDFKELDKSDLEGASFDPVDFNRLYKELVIGEENLPYVRKEINSAILETGVDNLFLLPSGSLPPNPSEVLGSERLPFLFSMLKKRFDLLIIDTPPVLPASDALIMAPHTDGVILISKAGLMNRDMVQKAVDQLRHARANLLGIVLNQVDIKREGYYKYYSKYYGDTT